LHEKNNEVINNIIDLYVKIISVFIIIYKYKLLWNQMFYYLYKFSIIYYGIIDEWFVYRLFHTDLESRNRFILCKTKTFDNVLNWNLWNFLLAQWSSVFAIRYPCFHLKSEILELLIILSSVQYIFFLTG